MMKSIFLSESKVLDLDGSPIANGTTGANKTLDNEYIMVDRDPELDYDADTNSELQDDDDYDYCDDVISEGMQYEPCSFTFSLTEDMILEEAEQPSIQRILDEAHESASQLVSDAPMPGILESSASDVSVQEKEPEPSEPPTTAEKPTAPDVPVVPTNQPPVGGRMSNKKRRKKMKLLKKAAAAAKAAAALASDIPQSANSTSPSTGTSKTKKGTKISPTTRYQNKRVANVAVACATETLASYKAELKASSKKVH